MKRSVRSLILVSAPAVAAATAWAACSRKVPYGEETNAAKAKMMAAMDVRSSGDADADFVAMMIPHHQGAIDLARTELRYGRNEQLRRLAQEIIVTQQQEITAMRLAIGEPLLPSVAPPARPSPTASTGGSDVTDSARTRKEP